MPDCPGHPVRVVFLSTSESEGICLAIRSALLDMRPGIVEARFWRELFGFGDITIDQLLSASKTTDYAILILTADDYTRSRGIEQPSPRDNLIFEMGLFMAALGRSRAIVVKPDVSMKIPSDIAGMTTARYRQNDSQDTAARTVAHALAQHFNKHGRRLVCPEIEGWYYHDVEDAFEFRIKGGQSLADFLWIDRLGERGWFIISALASPGSTRPQYLDDVPLVVEVPKAVSIPAGADLSIKVNCKPLRKAGLFKKEACAWGFLFYSRTEIDLNGVKSNREIIDRGARLVAAQGIGVDSDARRKMLLKGINSEKKPSPKR